MYHAGGNNAHSAQGWAAAPPRPPAIGGYSGGPPPAFVPAQLSMGGVPHPPGIEGNGYARPPPSGMSYGPGAYTGPPPPVNAPPGQQAHTTIFVGTIAAGVTDEWLTRLLAACGYLRSFKRVSSAFGFAEYSDPESVLRALAVLAGKELPAMGRAAIEKQESMMKKLTVKADEKTKKFLAQYEQGRARTSEHEHNEFQAANAVASIIAQMADPANARTSDVTPSYDVPSHLRDLPPEELPEEHRGTVLSEIDKFRQASAARDDERKRRERVQELERMRSSSSADRGPPGRAHNTSTGGIDPQSYTRPVSFVPSQQAQQEKDMPADERDEREEQRRRQHEAQERERTAHEAEKRFLAAERNRLAHWTHEEEQERARDRELASKALSTKRRYEDWDQAYEMDHDIFYLDRKRWRSVRRSVRQREKDEDEADRKAEVREAEEARVQAERFLAQQAEEMAAFEREQRAAGVLMPNDGIHAPLKLKRVTAGTDDAQPKVAAGLLGTAEDDAETVQKRKGRLAHIDVTDEETKRERYRASLPTDTQELFAIDPNWDKLHESAMEGSYKSMLDEAIVENLGEAAPDLVEALLEILRKRGSAADLIDAIEAVLEDDAGPLIRRLWTEMLVDSRYDE